MPKVSPRLVSCLVLASVLSFVFAGLTSRAQAQARTIQKPIPKEKVLPKQGPSAEAGSVPQFKIGEFTVVVGAGRSPGVGRATGVESRPQVTAPLAKTGAGLSGQGRVTIRGQKVPVTFSDVILARAGQGQVPVATAGIVRGTDGAPFAYDLEGFKIKLERPSIKITPESATAAASLSLSQAPFMAPGRDNVLTLSSPACGIAPDGSLAADDFRGPTSFLLRSSPYRLEVPADAMQSVHLGTPASRQAGRPKTPPGCAIRGAASFSGTELFAFQGTVESDGRSAAFTLVLSSPPVVRTPEPGYELVLHSGVVNLAYTKKGALTCGGDFQADIRFPQAIKRFDAQGLELRGLALKTDETGALFNTITIPDRLRAGFGSADRSSDALFLIEPLPGAVWAYFPKWQAPGPSSSYPMLQGGAKITDGAPDCGAVLRFLETPAPDGALPRNAPKKNVLRRPGVTVLQGTLYFKARQATSKAAPPAPPGDPAAAGFNLKTLFWGGLTMTPWGITGTATSSGSSFVPAGLSIEECTKPSGTSRPTWEEILGAGARRPVEPVERFLLSGLRILEMRVENLLLCANALPANGAAMRYIVHFPFPSFIDLDFADDSLDARGLFASAAGPVASKSWAFPQNPSRAEVDAALAGQLKKGAQEKLNPDTRILWLWRLPVSFSDRGVIIAYKGAAGGASVNVTMKPYDPTVPEIMSSEIWLRPLFSRNSGIKAGVRFSAALGPDGGFALTGWDTAWLTFGKLYAAPSMERAEGFDCRLDQGSGPGIVLAETSSDPAARTTDLRWNGSLRFPFFGPQDVHFQVRNLIPEMPAPIAELTATNPASSRCQTVGTTVKEMPGQDPSQTLTATVRNLRYSSRSYPFQSQDATVFRAGAESRGIMAYFSSFTCGEIRLEARPEDRVIPLHATADSCGGTKAARHMMKNAISNKDVVDLVCYDPEAYAARGLTDACCQEYWLGTYEVTTGPPGSEKLVFKATNAKWYPKAVPFALFFNSSDAVFSSDEIDNPHRTFVNIPGAGLKQDATGALVGAFGATMTSLASSLPYEGEFRFYLDPNCGYFYLLSAGSFTYYLRFSGEVFIVNAPYKIVKRPPDFIGETRLLETLSMRALFPRPEDFEQKTGLGQLSDDTVVSGVFQAGNASYTFGAGPLSVNLAAGAGTYLYQFRASTGTTYCFGTFQNARAVASAAIVSAEADLILAQGPVTTGSASSLEDFFGRSELTASGTLLLCACADIYLAHVQALARGDASFSTRSGLRFSGTVKADWGTGGCSPCR